MTPDEALAEVERIVAAGGETDDVLRAVVAALGQRYSWVAVRFNEGGELLLGPTAGTEGGERVEQEIVYKGERVGLVEVDAASVSDADRELVARTAERIALLTLVGWDTGGEPWNP